MNIIFRYQPPSDYLIKTIENNHVYLSFPSEYNDPFDCRFRFNYEGNKQNWLNWLDRQSLNSSDKSIFRKVIESPNFNYKDIINENAKHLKATVICSFSEKSDNILMWSHYSKNHSGICLGYKVTSLANSYCLFFDDPNVESFSPKYFHEGEAPLYRVEYRDTVPDPVNFFEKSEESIKKFMITKASDWSYEKEWRLLYPKALVKKQVLSLRRDTLQSVYLGAKINSDLKNEVIETIKSEYLQQGVKIDVFQQHLSNDSYSLVTEKLDI
jgi:hypothetical protein